MTESTKKRLLALGPDGKPTHPYVHSSQTDIRKLFRRVERERKEAEAVKTSSNVKTLKSDLTSAPVRGRTGTR